MKFRTGTGAATDGAMADNDTNSRDDARSQQDGQAREYLFLGARQFHRKRREGPLAQRKTFDHGLQQWPVAVADDRGIRCIAGAQHLART